LTGDREIGTHKTNKIVSKFYHPQHRLYVNNFCQLRKNQTKNNSDKHVAVIRILELKKKRKRKRDGVWKRIRK